ncbi:caspase family protein [Saprospira sp. CCB-QB6]|uniref:caspase family protein n=1 Tax=Saprospira sp. CCB-QB6 TaxID=3023936 RepID=UPI00234A2020|nr:caspase family protein [Saprospira sp. CCB-QB6]WCL81124.1 caspase family protein [Saprospira sp. CCB-QB6]
MSQKFHALFIGVDAYNPAVTSLNGCVNDALSMFKYLARNVDRNKFQFEPKLLLSPIESKKEAIATDLQHYQQDFAQVEMPNRDIILSSLKSYTQKVQPGDTFFLFYAGHGSTEKAHPYFKEPTGQLQTLVAADSRSIKDGKKVKDVLDKEIRFLIRQIWVAGQEKVDIIFVQDSCHSAGATRSDLEKKMKELSGVISGEEPVNAAEMSFEEDFEAPDLDFGDGGMDLFDELQEEEQPTENSSEELLVQTRMVPAEPEQLGQYRKAEEMDFFDEEARSAMKEAEESPTASRSLGRGSSRSAAPQARGQKKPPFELAYPEGNQIHMSACGKGEYAYEVRHADGQKGGVFTHTIIKILSKYQGDISYHDLFNQAKLTIDGAFEQSPSLYVKGPAGRRYERFLGGQMAQKEGEVNLIYKKESQQWRIDMGAFLGLPVLREGQAIPLKAYDPARPNLVFDGRITYVMAEAAVVEFDQAPPISTTGLKAFVDQKYSSQPLAVHLPQSNRYEVMVSDSLRPHLTDKQEEAAYVIELKNGNFRFYPKGQAQSFVEFVYYKKPALRSLNLGDYIQPQENGPNQDSLWTKLHVAWQQNKTRSSGQAFFKINLGSGDGFFLTESGDSIQVSDQLDLEDLWLPDAMEAQQQIALMLWTLGEKAYLEPEAGFDNVFKQQIEASLAANYYSKFINWNAGPEAPYQVRIYDGRYYICDGQAPEIVLTKGTANTLDKSAFSVLAQLRSISRWEQLKKLENPHPGAKNMLADYQFSLSFKLQKNWHTLYVRTQEQAPFYYWEDAQGRKVEELKLSYVLAEGGFEKEFLSSMILRQQSASSASPIFASTLFLGYDYSIICKTPLGSTEFAAYDAQSGSNNQLQVEIGELKTYPPIFDSRQLATTHKKAEVVYKFLVAYKRFDPSNWLQEGLPLPTDEDYAAASSKTRAVLARKKGDGAADHLVFSLPIQLMAQTDLIKEPLDQPFEDPRNRF